jgi:hypothetical protein
MLNRLNFIPVALRGAVLAGIGRYSRRASVYPPQPLPGMDPIENLPRLLDAIVGLQEGLYSVL